MPAHSYANPGDWATQAACAGDIDGMTMPREHSQTRAAIQHITVAIARCEQCPVLHECRLWALTTPDPATGLVAGGHTPNQRQRIRRGLPAGTYHGGRYKVMTA